MSTLTATTSTAIRTTRSTGAPTLKSLARWAAWILILAIPAAVMVWDSVTRDQMAAPSIAQAEADRQALEKSLRELQSITGRELGK